MSYCRLRLRPAPRDEGAAKRMNLPPLRIGDTVVVTVTVKELMPEKSRARLLCVCAVGGETVLDGEALVKVPSARSQKGKRPMMKL
jgi:acyl-CoA thioesterase FadM